VPCSTLHYGGKGGSLHDDTDVGSSFHTDHKHVANFGEGGSLHDDIDVGSSLHTDHKHVANFLPAPVKNAYPRVCIR